DRDRNAATTDSTSVATAADTITSGVIGVIPGCPRVTRYPTPNPAASPAQPVSTARPTENRTPSSRLVTAASTNIIAAKTAKLATPLAITQPSCPHRPAGQLPTCPSSVTPAIPASPTLGTGRLAGHRPAGHNPGGLVCRKAYRSPSSRRRRPRGMAGGGGAPETVGHGVPGLMRPDS